MPKLGDVIINNVEKESYNEKINATDHPIEGGGSAVDHVEKTPVSLSITGVIVGKDADAKLKKLREYMNSGKLLKYTYKTTIDNVIIESLPHDHVVEIKNGFQFNMSLKQIRISKVGVVAPTANKKKTAPVSNKGLQQPKGSTPAKTYVVKSGDSLAKIAAKYGVSLQKLYDKNRGVIGKDMGKIYPGQKLIIP